VGSSQFAKEDGSGEYGKKDGAKKRLDTEASIVNLAELLDYFETICPGMCKHRHTLKECKEAAQELFRNAPLGSSCSTRISPRTS
jgi:hypothetical protein